MAMFRGKPINKVDHEIMKVTFPYNFDDEYVYGDLVTETKNDKKYILVSSMVSRNTNINNTVATVIEVEPDSIAQWQGITGGKDNRLLFDDDLESRNINEICPHCNNVIHMMWNIKDNGCQAFCPHCGKVLILCDECCHENGECSVDCDWRESVGCKHYRYAKFPIVFEESVLEKSDFCKGFTVDGENKTVFGVLKEINNKCCIQDKECNLVEIDKNNVCKQLGFDSDGKAFYENDIIEVISSKPNGEELRWQGAIDKPSYNDIEFLAFAHSINLVASFENKEE